MELFSTQPSFDFPAALAERYRPRAIAEFIGLPKTEANCECTSTTAVRVRMALRTVWIFTMNSAADRLEVRFLSRTKLVEFSSYGISTAAVGTAFADLAGRGSRSCSRSELRPHCQRGLQQRARGSAGSRNRTDAGRGCGMRTSPPHILPGCLYCNFDHDPAIECRYKPESARFQLPERSSHVEHVHEPIKNLIEMRKSGLSAIRTDHCSCGAVRYTKITGTIRQPGEWMFPEDPPPAPAVSAQKQTESGSQAEWDGGDGSPPPLGSWITDPVGRWRVSELNKDDGGLCVHCRESEFHHPSCIVAVSEDRAMREMERQRAAKPLENGSQKASKLPYVAKHGSVLQGSARLATARSNSFAKKIVAALNHLESCDRQV